METQEAGLRESQNNADNRDRRGSATRRPAKHGRDRRKHGTAEDAEHDSVEQEQEKEFVVAKSNAVPNCWAYQESMSLHTHFEKTRTMVIKALNTAAQ